MKLVKRMKMMLGKCILASGVASFLASGTISIRFTSEGGNKHQRAEQKDRRNMPSNKI